VNITYLHNILPFPNHRNWHIWPAYLIFAADIILIGQTNINFNALAILAHRCYGFKKIGGIMKRFIVLFSLFALVGCASTTTFKSEPIGADVYIDNVKICKTPCQYSDTAIMGSSKPVKVVMEGYKPLETTIRKEKAQVGPILGTFLTPLSFIWILGYQDEYNYILDKNM
jgi:hypothetical protein